MKIQSVDLIKVDIPYHEPFRIALGASDSTNNLFVRVRADNGLHGTGEASPTRRITGETQGTVVEISTQLAKLLIGRDPLQISERVADMRALFAHNTTARSAFDLALYDLAAKAAGEPLYAYLGGTKRSFWTDNTVGINTPEKMVSQAKSYLNEGFRAIKVKLGTTLNEDIERVRMIRAAIGQGIALRIDANQGWDRETAKSVLEAIQSEGIEYCEQPVKHWDFEGLREVRQSTSIPIMADESLFDVHDAERLAVLGCCDYFNIKLAKSSGILGGLQIAELAERKGIPCMVGSMSETTLGLSAAAHLVSARPIIRYADLDTHFDHTINPVVGGVEITADEVRLSDSPGHGAEVDPEFEATADVIRVE